MSSPAAARPTYAQASRALRRDVILDAVGELLADHRWRDVTMGDVATRAGVSRQTLYNAFGGREDLAAAYLLREAERFLAAIEGAVADNADDPRAALRAALELFLSLVGPHPLIRAAISGESDELIALATTRGGRLLDEMSGRLATLLCESWPGLDPADARITAETLVRLAISHAALPTAGAAETAEHVARVLGPFLDGLLAEIELRKEGETGT